MATIEIVNSLAEEIKKKFKRETHKIIDMLYSTEESPQKGKLLGNVGGIVIKELTDLLLKSVRMSDKKNQQRTIGEIKHILVTIGAGGFE